MLNPMNTVVKTNNRIHVADALRGLAIVGIILMHASEQFNMYDPSIALPYTLECDAMVAEVASFLLSGKMYGIFALLFGLSFFIMNDNQQKKGKSFLGRFAWRMILLMGFGILNTVFYDGDILFTYAYLGLFLIPISLLPNRWAIALTIFLACQPLDIYFLVTDNTVDPSDVWTAYSKMGEAHHQGTFMENAWANLRYGQYASFMWFLMFGRLTQTLMLFVLGMLIGRARMFYDEGDNLKRWSTILLLCVTGYAGMYTLAEYSSWGSVFRPIQNFCMTMAIVAAVTLLWYKTTWMSRIAAPLTVIGKMSMTNYFLQSILGCAYFCAYGMGLSNMIGITYSMLVGIVIIIIQYQLCRIWARKNTRGPFESLWRRLTWIRL